MRHSADMRKFAVSTLLTIIKDAVYIADNMPKDEPDLHEDWDDRESDLQHLSEKVSALHDKLRDHHEELLSEFKDTEAANQVARESQERYEPEDHSHD